MKLVVATRNRHKLEEIRAILDIPGIDWLDLDQFPDVPPVVEDGRTFESNAIKKAVAVALACRLWTLSDDSGLEVDALRGEPGVRSARFAGEPSDAEANNAKLLRLLGAAEDRRARFRCVIALASPQGHAQFVEGVCEGRMAYEPRGTGGFGYDPLFLPDGHDRTFAELPAETKNHISHRAHALRRARRLWGEVLASGAGRWPSVRPIRAEEE